MSEAVRGKPDRPAELPTRRLLRAFGYYERRDPRGARRSRGRAWSGPSNEAPGHADCWAMLVDDVRRGVPVRVQSPSPTLSAAHSRPRGAPSRPRPSNHVCVDLALAQAHYFRKESRAFRVAAERAIALNPAGRSHVSAYLAHLLAYAGDWERGCALVERARQLNPHHPAWYWFLPLLNAYRRGDYRGARAFASRSSCRGSTSHTRLFAAVYGQLGEREAAAKALESCWPCRPDFADDRARTVREVVPAGARRAADRRPPQGGARGSGGRGSRRRRRQRAPGRSPKPRAIAAVAIAVLPFSDMSPAKDQEYLCEGMAEEIMNALVRDRRDPRGVADLGLPRAAVTAATWPRSPVRSRWATSSRAACARRAAGCGSPPSSPTSRAATSSGPSASIGRRQTSSPSRTRSPPASSRR